MIDVHVLHLPGERADWRAACDASLVGHPITVHHLDGTPRDYLGSRLRGFSVGSHPFVSFVDPDDVVLPNAFAICLANFAIHQLAVAIYTDSLRLQENEPMHSARPIRFNRPHQVVVARRKVIDEVVQSGESFKDDAGFWSAVKKRGQVHHLPFVGYVWRDHSQGHHRSQPLAP